MNVKQFKQELRTLLQKYDAYLFCDIEGDTFGIVTNGIKVCDCKSKEWYTLSEFSVTLDSEDLK